MNILDNELVKKYFGTPENTAWVTNIPYPEKEFMAYRVLVAMQEPIEKGEKVLAADPGGQVSEISAMVSRHDNEFHPYLLRLPDAFQPKAEKCEHAAFYMKRWCAQCGQGLKEKPGQMIPCDEPMNHPKGCEHQKPDPVEEKMVDIWIKRSGLMQELRDLIALARGSK